MVEINDLGIFKVWVVVGIDFYIIKVNVLRIFYVNCYILKEGVGISKFSVFYFLYNFFYGFNNNSNKIVLLIMWILCL